MSTVTKVGDFTVRTLSNGTLVVGDGEIFVAPGEQAEAVNVVSAAMRFSDMSILPPKVTYEPFRVKFSPSGECELVRLDKNEAGLKFTFSQGDDLIKAISEGVDRHVQEETLGGGPKKMARGLGVPDPLI